MNFPEQCAGFFRSCAILKSIPKSAAFYPPHEKLCAGLYSARNLWYNRHMTEKEGDGRAETAAMPENLL